MIPLVLKSLYRSVFCFLLLIVLTEAQETIQRIHLPNPLLVNNERHLQEFNLDLDKSLTLDTTKRNFSFCFWYRPYPFQLPEENNGVIFHIPNLLTLYGTNLTFDLGLMNNDNRTQCYTNFNLENSGIELLSLTWNFLCFSFLSNKEIVLKIMNISISEQNCINMEEGNAISITQVQFLRSSSVNAVGDIAGIQFLERNILLNEVSSQTNCDPAKLRETISLQTGVNNDLITNISSSYPCEQEDYTRAYFFLPFSSDLDEAKTFCKSFHGRPILYNESLIAARNPTFYLLPKQFQSLVVHEEGDVCYSIKYGMPRNPIVTNCSSIYSYVGCSVSTQEAIYFLGFFENDEIKFQHQYTNALVLSNTLNEFLFSSVSTSDYRLIAVRNNNAGYPSQVYYNINKKQLLGRFTWFEENENLYSQIGTTVAYKSKLSLSYCSPESCFICSDGKKCISGLKLCDSHNDCDDNSDEDMSVCSKKFVRDDQPSCYWINRTLSLEAFIDVYSVGDLQINTNSFSVFAGISISWKDPCLLYQNLIAQKENNDIDDFIANGQIWVPELQGNNTSGSTTVLGTDKSYSVEVDDSYLGTYIKQSSYGLHQFDGSNATITQHLEFVEDFQCVPEQFLFPFDVQVCCMNLEIRSLNPTLQIGNMSYNVMERSYSSLPSYDVLSFKLQNYTSSNLFTKACTVYIRRYTSYIFTIYCPSILLTAISYITLASFRLDDFTNKITVTLSLFIVAATLFSQTSSTLPTTPTLKIIELFFFYILCRLFFTFSVHALVGYYYELGENEDAARHSLTNLAKVSDYPSLANKRKTQNFKKTAFYCNRAGLALGAIADALLTIGMVAYTLFEEQRILSSYRDT